MLIVCFLAVKLLKTKEPAEPVRPTRYFPTRACVGIDVSALSSASGSRSNDLAAQENCKVAWV